MQMGNKQAQDDGQATFEKMTAALIKHIFGAGEQGIREQLQSSQDLPKDIGTLAYTLVEQGSKQAAEARVDLDLDIVFGVATEVIDSLMQLAEAIGVLESADDQDVREQSLIYAVNAYLALAKPGPEEREAAMQMLEQLSQSGEVDQAAKTLQEVGKKAGVDPFAQQPAPVDGAGGPPQPAEQPGRPRPQLMQG